MPARPNQSPSTRPSRPSAALITSRDNKWLKHFRMALRGGLPTESGAVGVEGPRLVEEALRSSCSITAVLFSESGERHHARLAPFLDRGELNITILHTTDRLFEGIADTEHPQGVAALVTPRTYSFDDISQSSADSAAPLIVVLAGLQDPGNVGAVLRTAAAFGATAAVTTSSGHGGGTTSPFSPKALRASAGAALHLPILSGMSLPILFTQFKIAGILTVATSSHETGAVQVSPLPSIGAGHVVPSSADSAYLPSPPESSPSRHSQLPIRHFPWHLDWRQPIALLIGNEGQGLPEEIERSADALVRIPISSSVESLNAAAAAAVLFYEASRQRNSARI